MKVIVSVVDSKGKKQTFALREKPIVIGRSENAHVKITDELASGTHCMICFKDNSIYIEDLQSKNGIYLNGVKVYKQRMFIDDKIKIGNTILYVEIDRLEPEVRKILTPVGTGNRFKGEMTLELDTFNSKKKNLVSHDNQLATSSQKDFVKNSKLYSGVTGNTEALNHPKITRLKLILKDYLALLIDIVISIIFGIIPIIIFQVSLPEIYQEYFPKVTKTPIYEQFNYQILIGVTLVLSLIIFKLFRSLKKGSIGERILGLD